VSFAVFRRASGTRHHNESGPPDRAAGHTLPAEGREVSMKPIVLYLVALALHVTLLWLFTHFHYYRRNPAFWLWLMCGLGVNGALIIMRWAGELRGFYSAERGADMLYYALTAWVLASALAGRADVVNQIIWRGAFASLMFSVVARVAGNFGLTGRISPDGIAANAINAIYLAPAAWMLLKLAGLRSDQHPLIAWTRESGFAPRLSDAFGYARSILT